jgi:hypothetical protein
MKIKNFKKLLLLMAVTVLISITLIDCGSGTDTVVGPKLEHNCSNPSNPNCDER